MSKIALLPGGFKPPHAGHYNMAKWLSANTGADTTIIFVGPKERDGITQEMSLKLWKIYTQNDSGLEIRPAGVSPVRDVYDFVEQEAPEESTVFLGMGEKDISDKRFANIPKFAEPRGITFETKLVPPQAGGVSGTQMRGFIKDNDKANFQYYLPDHLSNEQKDQAWDTVTGLDEDLYNPEDKVLNYMRSSVPGPKDDIPRAYKYKRGGLYTRGGMYSEDAQFEKGKVLHVYDFDDTIARVKANIRTVITSPKGDYYKELLIPAEKFPEESKELEARLGNLDITYDFGEFEKQISDAIVNSKVVSKLKNSLSRPDIKTTILTARSIGHPVTRYLKKDLGLDAYVVPLGMQVDGKVRGIDKANWIEKHIKKGYQTIYFIDDSEENRVAVASLKDKYPDIKLTVEDPAAVSELMYGMMTKQEKAKHAKNLKRLKKDLKKQGDQYMEVPDYLKGTLKRKMYERKLTKGELKDKERIFKDLKKNKADFKKRYGKDAENVMYATATARAKKEGMYPPYKADQVQKVRYQASDTFTNSPKQAKKRGYLEEIGIDLSNYKGQILPGDVLRAPKGFPLGGKKLEKSIQLKVIKNSREGVNRYKLSLEDKDGKKYTVRNFQMDGEYKGKKLPKWGLVRKSRKNINEALNCGCGETPCITFGMMYEADPKKGTGKKPKGSGRRLYTDEDPSDTVKVKFSTRQDIVDTLSKKSFKAKSHARKSQIINLIHQRVRAALSRTKDPKKKAKLRSGFEYIKKRKEASKRKTKRMKKEGALTKAWWKEQLKEIITETKANTHLTHLEELVLTQGQDGFNQAKNFLYELIKNLKGQDNTIKNVSVKWDGAPAIFTGINPDNGQFFVGTKSVFNKEPKINYTPKDIDQNHGQAAGLAKKLKLALQYLPSLGIKNILQGDFMFDNDDVETEDIDGTPHYTFKPNTIRYAVEANSELGKQIIAARIGIIFHTTYNDLSGGGASFGADVSGLSKSPSVWFDDAFFKDDTGILLSDKEEQFVLDKIDEADAINVDYTNLPLKNLNTYINSEIRQGEFLNDPSKSFERFKNWYQQAVNKSIEKVKRPETKEKKKQAGEEKLREFESQKQDIINIFKVSKLLSEAKSIFITKYDKAVATKHFIDNGDGTLRVTKAEGFVAVDHTENGIKLVDRLEFSKNNFNAGKPGAKK